MAELLVSLVPLALGGVGYFFKTKYSYKKQKKMIYRGIKFGLENADFEKVAEWADKLDKFDDQARDAINGQMKKKSFEKLFGRKRIPKMEKVDKLFGLPKNIITDARAMKKRFELELHKDNIGKKILEVEEEEKKDEQVKSLLHADLEKIRRKEMAKLHNIIKTIDSLKISEVIDNIHKEYEGLLNKKFNEESDVQSIIQKQMKKDLLKKRLLKINQVQNKQIDEQIITC